MHHKQKRNSKQSSFTSGDKIAKGVLIFHVVYKRPEGHYAKVSFDDLFVESAGVPRKAEEHLIRNFPAPRPTWLITKSAVTFVVKLNTTLSMVKKKEKLRTKGNRSDSFFFVYFYPYTSRDRNIHALFINMKLCYLVWYVSTGNGLSKL